MFQMFKGFNSKSKIGFQTNNNTFNVMGACVSRNIFNQKVGLNCQVTGYSFNHNPFLLFQKRLPNYEIKEDTFKQLYNPEFNHDFPKRCMNYLINGGMDKYLLENKGKWLVMDTHYSTYNQIKVNADGITFFEQSCYAGYYGKIFRLQNNTNYTVEKLNEPLNMYEHIDPLCRYLDNWKHHIILLVSKPAEYYFENGQLKQSSYNIWKKNTLRNQRMANFLLKHVECTPIEVPFTLISGDPSSLVHYTDVINQYLKLKIDLIITDKDNDYNNQILEEKYSKIISDVMDSTPLDSNNS